MADDPTRPLGTSGWPGQLAPATDELYRRPVRTNPDPVTASHIVGPSGGSYGTARSLGFGDDRGEVVAPQIVNGFLLTPRDAVTYAQRTGRNFGRFDTPEHADFAAQKIHELQSAEHDLTQTNRPLSQLQDLADTSQDFLAKRRTKPLQKPRSLSKR